MDKDIALKLALEALGAYMEATDSDEDAKAHSLMAQAFFAIKEALAQPAPVQEPDWMDKEKPKTDWDHVWLLIKAAAYASSRGHMSGTTNWGVAMSTYLRHETNAAAQPAPVQEAFGYFRAEPFGLIDCDETDEGAIALYEHPAAQRTWVGLTDDEADEIYASVQEEVNEHWDKGGTTMMFPLTLYTAIEAKLRSKNNV